MNNYKFYLKSILYNQHFFFLDNLAQKVKEDSVFITSKSLYFLTLHLRLSSLFYATQLVDIFSYEATRNLGSLSSAKSPHNLISKSIISVVVYNYHNLLTQNRLFIFCSTFAAASRSKFLGFSATLFSIAELFYSANWLEREVAELHGIIFLGKKDLRNLMLQYGDTTAPFQKSFPTIGLREMFYNPLKDVIIQSPVSLQI